LREAIPAESGDRIYTVSAQENQKGEVRG